MFKNLSQEYCKRKNGIMSSKKNKFTKKKIYDKIKKRDVRSITKTWFEHPSSTNISDVKG